MPTNMNHQLLPAFTHKKSDRISMLSLCDPCRLSPSFVNVCLESGLLMPHNLTSPHFSFPLSCLPPAMTITPFSTTSGLELRSKACIHTDVTCPQLRSKPHALSDLLYKRLLQEPLPGQTSRHLRKRPRRHPASFYRPTQYEDGVPQCPLLCHELI